MTLSSQLEALTRSNSFTKSMMDIKKEKENKNVKNSGEFSFLRRKLSQLRSGKFKRDKGASASESLTRSYSMTRVDIVKRESIWGGSLPSLDENSIRDSDSSELNKLESATSTPPVICRKQSKVRIFIVYFQKLLLFYFYSIKENNGFGTSY